ncbi:mitochondrial import inner membrane translocase subunit-like [Raphidocelis subcapitata]|uniref:Mitochondrial import inner membrane translocase subunit-like n=1 Tax=Raphidocelis subcapitata TaxID=307507 RepID=A0A2V0P3K0_9CHLO|nr:mitochondrial import inner membrane translocase subunit-like [Raphidocelis subcapitata]|eukprot:GBF94438.1 mitochondrial import inner membrane translocase subunit-like [Raphidocelis subcapitata]
MGFLDRLVGRQPQPAEEDASAAAQQQQQQQQQPHGGTSTSGEVLRDIAPAAGGGFPGGAAARLYDPYEGISTAVGGRKAAFQLPDGPEFVFQEEAAARRRGWGENLQFYTGLGYLGGGATGFALGGYKFLAQGPTEPALSSAKLRANRLINMSGSLGRRFACASAILGLYFASFESYVYHAADGRVPDGACTAAAGFLTAALFRSPRGPKSASVAGLVGAAATAGLHAARQKWPSL